MKKIKVSIAKRPRCIAEGCNNPGQHLGTYDKNGHPNFRKFCSTHHHPYKKHKKNFCENRDGHLGFSCTTTEIIHSVQLEVDHISSNRSNNRKNNLQTLCANCHRYKTYLDYHNPKAMAARKRNRAKK